MASWLKVAEDLFEVVDRRAKRVVSELADEQSGPQQSASNGLEVQTKRKDEEQEGLLRSRNSETFKGPIPQQELQNVQSSLPDLILERVETAGDKYLVDVATTSNTVEDNGEAASVSNNNILVVGGPFADAAQYSKGVHDTENVVEVPVIESQNEASTSSPTDNTISNSTDALESSSSSFSATEVETTNRASEENNSFKDNDTGDSGVNSVDKNTSSINTQERPRSKRDRSKRTTNSSESDQLDSANSKFQQGNTDAFRRKVDDQLDEAQGLLKNIVSTGQSKEARLARVCAGLSSRLQEYKSENAQLEELLVAERELSSSYEARIKQLQLELSAAKSEVTKVESSMADALAAKNSEMETLVTSMDALKKQYSSSEGKLASLQANMEEIMMNRELTETRMIQALREELATAERRAEEERAAHNATKMAAVQREVELEHRAVEASNALARMQRAGEESMSRATELEHKVALLEVECSSLTQELQDLKAQSQLGQKKSLEEANQILQMQAWQEEVERARQSQRDAENKITSLEAELQKMRVEMAGMQRDAEHYSRQEHMELEKRYRELTDLLYHKQTQLEAMASEKAAAHFQLEKEIKRHREVQVEAEINRVSHRASSLWEEDIDLKTLEPLPLHHRHMAAASVQLQRAAKLLDSGAVRATRFLWRYPIARVILLFYLVFVHLFLTYMLHRFQEQADSFTAREVAASMGLNRTSLL